MRLAVFRNGQCRAEVAQRVALFADIAATALTALFATNALRSTASLCGGLILVVLLAVTRLYAARWSTRTAPAGLFGSRDLWFGMSFLLILAFQHDWLHQIGRA